MPFAALLPVLFAAFQNPQDAPPAPDPAADMQEVVRLMDEVREAFRKTDQAIQDARNAADAPAGAESAVAEGLGGALAENDALLAKIEELLDKLPTQSSQQRQPQSGSQGRDPRQQPPNQPQNQQRQNGELPQDNRDASGPREQNYGNTRPPDALRTPFLYDPRFGAWGELPVRLQSALENATADTLPLRYRRWLEEYYRKAVETPR